MKNKKPFLVQFLQNPTEKQLKLYFEMFYVGTPKEIFKIPIDGHVPNDAQIAADKEFVGNVIDQVGRKWAAYFLNIFRLHILSGVFLTEEEKEMIYENRSKDSIWESVRERIREKYPKVYQTVKNWHSTDFYLVYSYNVPEILEKFLHFINLPFEEIQQIVPDLTIPYTELVNKFIAIEAEYKRKGFTFVPRKKTQLDWGVRVVEFDDNYFWEYLPTSYSRKEAEVMEHCGRSGRDWQLLSLREYLPKLDKYIVHLTFEIHRGYGFLGQRKGPQNTKPNERYHKYIAGLLLSPEVQLLVRSDYEADSDFQFDDFSDKFQKQVLAEKPWINSPVKYFKKHPRNALEIFEEMSGNEVKALGGDSYSVQKFDNIVEFIKQHDLKWLKDVFDDPQYDRYFTYDGFDPDFIEYALNMLEKSYKARYKKFEKSVRKQFPEYAETSLLELLRDKQPEEYNYLRWAWDEAHTVELQKEVFKLIEGAVEDQGIFSLVFPDGWHEEGYLATSLGDIAERVAAEFEYGGNSIEISLDDYALRKYIEKSRYEAVPSETQLDAAIISILDQYL